VNFIPKPSISWRFM